MDSLSKVAVINMIRKYASIEAIIPNMSGYDVFVLTSGVTIKLPADNSRIPMLEVFIIAEVKLDLSVWEMDYVMENIHKLDPQ